MKTKARKTVITNADDVSVTLNLPRTLADEIDRIRTRDYETRSSAIRRLIRLGITVDAQNQSAA